MRFKLSLFVTVLAAWSSAPALAQSSEPASPPLAVAAPAPAKAQFTLLVDSSTSLAWYQIDPHTSLLWATTCPEDPHWRPGDSRHSGWDTRGMPTPKSGTARVNESVIPLYARDVARPVCKNAVSGTITADDTLTWHGLQGLIKIDPTQLESGLDLRDRTAVKTIFMPWKWPFIRFQIDSLGDVTGTDTLKGNIYGTFFFRDVEKPDKAPFKAWREALGLRVTARLEMLPVDLVEAYGVGLENMRLALMPGVWRRIYFGVDAILKPQM
jgi:hypothetical protein